MRPHKLNKKTLPGFVETKCVQSAKKKHISLHPANTRRRPSLGQRWANVVDGGPALAQHRDNVPCLLGNHDILPISKKLNKVMIQ